MQAIMSDLLSLQTLLALVAGTFGGLVVGGLPGLSATMGMSLLIPITYLYGHAGGGVLFCRVRRKFFCYSDSHAGDTCVGGDSH